MSEENIVTVRLRRDRAQFLEVNLSTMLQRTWDAMASNLPDERRQALSRRALVLAAIDDAVRDALLEAGSHSAGIGGTDSALERPARVAGRSRTDTRSSTRLVAQSVVPLSGETEAFAVASV